VRAYRVPETGEVLYPVTLGGPDEVAMGDGLALAAPDSPEAAEWALVAQPMPEDMRPFLEELRAEAAQQG
jgi:hypothetical protein